MCERESEAWKPMLIKLKQRVRAGSLESSVSSWEVGSEWFSISDSYQTWLTFQFGAGDRVHVERNQLKQPMGVDGDGRDVKQSAKLFEHLNGASLKRFHSMKESFSHNMNVTISFVPPLTRSVLSVFPERAKKISQSVCWVPTGPSGEVLHRRCCRRFCRSLTGRVVRFDGLGTRPRDGSTSPCASFHRSDALSPSVAGDSSRHASAGWTRTGKRFFLGIH